MISPKSTSTVVFVIFVLYYCGHHIGATNAQDFSCRDVLEQLRNLSRQFNTTMDRPDRPERFNFSRGGWGEFNMSRPNNMPPLPMALPRPPPDGSNRRFNRTDSTDDRGMPDFCNCSMIIDQAQRIFGENYTKVVGSSVFNRCLTTTPRSTAAGFPKFQAIYIIVIAFVTKCVFMCI